MKNNEYYDIILIGCRFADKITRKRWKNCELNYPMNMRKAIDFEFYCFLLYNTTKKETTSKKLTQWLFLTPKGNYMIILKEKKINTILIKRFKKITKQDEKKLEKLIKEYEKKLNYEYMECPICHGDDLISYGSYKRNIGIGTRFKEIKIKRVYCKNCKHTHAIIPDFIKPYYQYESSYIDLTMLIINVKKITIKKIEEKIELYRQIVNNWRKRFREHKTRLEVMYNTTNLKRIFKQMEEEEFIKKYYNENGVYYFKKLPT